MTSGEQRTFLTADWHHVLGVTYPVDAERLAPHLPRGAAIDELEGSARVSLVAFGFRRTRVWGVAIPFHTVFPEVNLRFYVRLGDERAVVFIREFVPLPVVSLVARLFYNEPYRTTRMRAGYSGLGVAAPGAGDETVTASHRFGPRRRNRLEAVAERGSWRPQPGSSEHWLTHHDLGLGTARDGTTCRYRVEHPVWALHRVRDLKLDVDFAALYGEHWGSLRDAEPSHITFAAGSAVRIAPPVPA